jgi:hypothetical protein
MVRQRRLFDLFFFFSRAVACRIFWWSNVLFGRRLSCGHEKCRPSVESLRPAARLTCCNAGRGCCCSGCWPLVREIERRFANSDWCFDSELCALFCERLATTAVCCIDVSKRQQILLPQPESQSEHKQTTALSRRVSAICIFRRICANTQRSIIVVLSSFGVVFSFVLRAMIFCILLFA